MTDDDVVKYERTTPKQSQKQRKLESQNPIKQETQLDEAPTEEKTTPNSIDFYYRDEDMVQDDWKDIYHLVNEELEAGHRARSEKFSRSKQFITKLRELRTAMNDHPFEIDYVIEILNQIANLSSKFNTHKTKIGGLTYN